MRAARLPAEIGDARGRFPTADGEFVAPCGPTETVLAELLAATLGLDRVSAAAHFYRVVARTTN